MGCGCGKSQRTEPSQYKWRVGDQEFDSLDEARMTQQTTGGTLVRVAVGE